MFRPTNLRSYSLACSLYQAADAVTLPHGLQSQLMRAAQSVALNLSEGAAKASFRERNRFYQIAFASLREVQAVIDLEQARCASLTQQANQLGAMLYKLTRATASASSVARFPQPEARGLAPDA